MSTLTLSIGLFSLIMQPIVTGNSLPSTHSRQSETIDARPAVSAVEPPHWWSGHSVRTIQVLLRGRNLRAAHVSVDGKGITVGAVRSNDAGTYLFADLTIQPGAAIGERFLIVKTASGTTRARFALEKPLSRTDNFRGFSPADVMYLILPDRFCDGDATNNDPAVSRGLYDPTKTRFYHGGDFAGIRKQLPYLKALGVTAIWMTPIYDNANVAHPTLIFDGQNNIDYHGYAAVDYYGVEEHFGTLEELRALVSEAHRFGIKVVQDQVCNHVGPLHPWVEDSPTSTWFHGTKANHPDCDWKVWNLTNPNASAESQRQTLDGWFAGVLPDMNQEDPDVEQYLIQNSLWWIGTIGFDAIRQDTLPYVPRRFWQKWTTALKREFPHLTILGENNVSDPATIAFFQGGRKQFDGIDTGVDTLFDYGVYSAIRKGFSGDAPSLRPVQEALAADWLYPRPDLLVPFLSLHDVPCFPSLPGMTAERNRVALTLLLTLRGTPLLYFGDEIGLPGTDDPHNRRHFPGGFPVDTRNAFLPTGRTPDEEKTFQLVTQLTALRTKYPALQTGTMLDLYHGDQQFVYARRLPNGEMVMVGLNLGQQTTVSVPMSSKTTAWKDVLHAQGFDVTNGMLSLTLPAQSAIVLVPR